MHQRTGEFRRPGAELVAGPGRGCRYRGDMPFEQLSQQDGSARDYFMPFGLLSPPKTDYRHYICAFWATFTAGWGFAGVNLCPLSNFRGRKGSGSPPPSPHPRIFATKITRRHSRRVLLNKTLLIAPTPQSYPYRLVERTAATVKLSPGPCPCRTRPRCGWPPRGLPSFRPRFSP